MYMCVCMYTCVYVHVCVCMYMCVYVHVCGVCVYVHVCICTRVCVCTCVCMFGGCVVYGESGSAQIAAAI